MLKKRSRFIPELCLLMMWTLCALPVHGQTIIDLNSGKVRSKTMDDYSEEQDMKKRQESDSLAYVDHVRRALNALHSDSLDRAEHLFNMAIKTRPDAPGNYILVYNLGRIDLARGQYREAISKYDRVLRAHPEEDRARYDRAVCFYETSSLRAAEEDCAVLLRGHLEKEARIQTLFLCAAIQRKGRHPDKAKAHVEEILRLDPLNESAALLHAGLLEDLGQVQASLDKLSSFIIIHPDNVEGFVARAQLYQRIERPEAACYDYTSAIGISPKEASLYSARAEAYLQAGDRKAARRDLDKAVELGVPRAELQSLYHKALK